MAVPIFLTMMAGPAGLLSYLLLLRPWFKDGGARAGGTKDE